MLVIRRDQMQEFERADAPYFEERTVKRLKSAFPKHAAILGDEGLHAVVKSAIGQAAQYGMRQQGGAGLLADLQLLLGCGFDQDLQLPWASRVLNDSEIASENLRAQRLHAAAVTYLDRVCGPDGGFITAAIQRLREEPLQVPALLTDYETYARARLQAVWPQKFEYLAEAGTQQLIAHAGGVAQGYGINNPSGRLLILGLVYILGSGFDQDPMVPWAGNILRGAGQFDSTAARLSALYRQALEYSKLW